MTFTRKIKIRCMCVLLLPIMLSGCLAQNPVNTRAVTVEEEDWLLSGKPVFGENAVPMVLPDDDVMRLTPEMVEFTNNAAPAGGADRIRLMQLLKAFTREGALNLEYDPSATLTAEEVFNLRRANCLAFTHFIVALMREVGLTVHYNEVDVPNLWDMSGDSTLILYKHVNAIVSLDHIPDKVVDIAMEEYDTSFRQRKIPDSLALAQHYNNRAMELLMEDRYADAVRYMVKALHIEPGVAWLWANLGTLYRRSGNLQAAETAYRAALQRDPTELVAISNAARVYELQGDYATAAELHDRAAYFRERNPYYRYRQGLVAFANQEYELALEHTSAAIDYYKKEHRFYFLQGAVYSRLGNDRLAEENMLRAIDMADDNEQNARYRNKMDRLLSANHPLIE